MQWSTLTSQPTKPQHRHRIIWRICEGHATYLKSLLGMAVRARSERRKVRYKSRYYVLLPRGMQRQQLVIICVSCVYGVSTHDWPRESKSNSTEPQIQIQYTQN